MSRTSNSIKMVLSSSLCQIVVLVCGFILPPLLIDKFGSEVNGLLNLVKWLMSYFGIVCLGLGVSAQVALYKPLANKDWTAINGIMAAAKHFYNISGLIFVLLIFISAALVPILYESSIPTLDIVLIILITGIGSTSEYIIVAKYRIILSADQRQYIISRITSEGIFLNTLAIILLVKHDYGIVIIQLGSSIVYILRLLLTIRYVKRHYPNLSFKKEPPALNKLQNRWSAFSYQISRIIINLSPMIIVSIVGSLVDASVFSVYFMVFSSLAMIAGIFSSGLQAPFGEIIAKDEHMSLKRAFSSFDWLYSLILAISFCCTMVLLPSFVGSYIHNTDGIEYILPTFSFWMCISFYVSNFRIPYTTLIEAKGLFKENNKYNIIEAIAFVLLSAALVYKLGILGIAISGVLTSFPRTIHYVYCAKKHFMEAIPIKIILLKFILTIGLAIALSKVLSPEVYSNVFSWMLHSIPEILIITVTLLVAYVMIDNFSVKVIFKRINFKKIN